MNSNSYYNSPSRPSQVPHNTPARPRQQQARPQQPPIQQGRRISPDMRQVHPRANNVSPVAGARSHSPYGPSPVQPLRAYQQPPPPRMQPQHPSQMQRPMQNHPQTYPPTSRPQLQVAVGAANPFVDPPRAAFAQPPSPSLSSSETLVASPAGLSPHGKSGLPASPGGASIKPPGSATSAGADNDRMAPARIANGDGADFWKRFSMVAHEAEVERAGRKKAKDPWLSKEFRGSRKFKWIVWTIAILVFGGVAGALAWHFTHNNGPAVSQPTQHDFGLGDSSSRTRVAVGFTGTQAEPNARLAMSDEDTPTTPLATVAQPTPTARATTTTSVRTRAATATSTTTRIRATQSDVARVKRMHRVRREQRS